MSFTLQFEPVFAETDLILNGIKLTILLSAGAIILGMALAILLVGLRSLAGRTMGSLGFAGADAHPAISLYHPAAGAADILAANGRVSRSADQEHVHRLSGRFHRTVAGVMGRWKFSRASRCAWKPGRSSPS